MTDFSLDETILDMAQGLYYWSSEDCISILTQRDVESDPIRCYCFIVLTPGVMSCFLKVEDWKVRQVLCSGAGNTPTEAKQDLLNGLIQKAKDALAVPIKQVMES